jgi:hypothetical protein
LTAELLDYFLRARGATALDQDEIPGSAISPNNLAASPVDRADRNLVQTGGAGAFRNQFRASPIVIS